MQNKKIWDAVYKPPVDALKQIKGGRLSGMTDIKPQWRYDAATEIFGPCGIGWKFKTVERWLDAGPEGEIIASVMINFFYKHEGEWSEPIEGTGGSMLIAKETKGLRASDEAYKMATTDAIGTAMKMLGFGGAIYAGKFDGSKYTDGDTTTKGPSEAFNAYIYRMEKCNTLEDAKKWYDSNSTIINEDVESGAMTAIERMDIKAKYSQLVNRLEMKK